MKTVLLPTVAASLWLATLAPTTAQAQPAKTSATVTSAAAPPAALAPLAALLTAYADTGAAIDAINLVDVDHYLLKPWEPPEEKLYPVVDELVAAWRREGRPAEHKIKILGHPWSSDSYAVRDFLARNSVPYRWYNIEEPDGARLLETAGATADDVPVLVLSDGSVLKSPSESEIASAVGLTTTPATTTRCSTGSPTSAARRGVATVT